MANRKVDVTEAVCYGFEWQCPKCLMETTDFADYKPKMLICKKCGATISLQDGQWQYD